MIASTWRPLLRKAARSYVAGPELTDALRLAQTFVARGVPASTLCFWDAQDDLPRHVADMYLAAVQAIRSARLDSYVSIKAPSLAFDAGLVVEIAEAAWQAGVRLHFDSLGAETVDHTFQLIEQLLNRFVDSDRQTPLPDGRGSVDAATLTPLLLSRDRQGAVSPKRLSTRAPLGCTIPGRWRRSPRDAERAVQMGLRVRVVKGQWADPGAAVDPHSAFLDVIDALAGGAAPVAVATHHPVLAAAAIRKLQSAGTPCEMELLYGLPSRAVLKVARDLGVPVRYYLPYGHAWLPYALRHARRDPRILWWVLRDASRTSLATIHGH